jgi:hypothetical protein
MPIFQELVSDSFTFLVNPGAGTFSIPLDSATAVAIRTPVVADRVNLRRVAPPFDPFNPVFVPAPGAFYKFFSSVSAQSSLNSTDTAAFTFKKSAVAFNQLRLSASPATKLNLRSTISERLRLRDLLTFGRPMTALDSISVSATPIPVEALRVLEQLNLSDVTLNTLLARLTVAETIRLRDLLEKFFSGEVVETTSFEALVVPLKRAVAQVNTGVSISETVARNLVLRLSVPDGVSIGDVDLQQLIYRPTLLDAIEIAVAFISPGNTFSVWNVNAATGAVSEYDNYAFNSFGNFGQMYLGADSEGLYELNGCNDEGSAIIARIRSGLAQLTQSRFTMLRDAYIGMRSDGSFVLRITTGEGEVYNYAFDNQNMKSTRVQLGKGMRTRYFSFELISTGSDFDLDSVEFIPLSSTRRV